MYYINYTKDGVVNELPIMVDFATIKTITNKLNIKLSEFEKIVDDLSATEKLVFEALKRGHKLDGKELLIKESEVEDILSESYADFLQIFNKCVLQMFTPTKKN